MADNFLFVDMNQSRTPRQQEPHHKLAPGLTFNLAHELLPEPAAPVPHPAPAPAHGLDRELRPQQTILPPTLKAEL